MDAKEFRAVISKSAFAKPDAYESLINTNEFSKWRSLNATLLDQEMLSMHTKGRANLSGPELDALIADVRAARLAVMATPEFKALI